jgi:hypothetical protein
LLIGSSAAIVIATVLVAPIVLLTGSNGTKPCAQSLLYLREPYTARPIASTSLVQGLAIGVGVTRGCGAPPSNVNVRSLRGVEPAVAVGLSGEESSIYVRRGVCTKASPGGLLDCVSGSTR